MFSTRVLVLTVIALSVILKLFFFSSGCKQGLVSSSVGKDSTYFKTLDDHVTQPVLFIPEMHFSTMQRCGLVRLYFTHTYTHALPYILGYAAHRSIVESCSPTPRGLSVWERERKSVGKNVVGKKWAWKRIRESDLEIRHANWCAPEFTWQRAKLTWGGDGRADWQGLTRRSSNTRTHTSEGVEEMLFSCVYTA